jgi:hypothetical protein
MTKKWWLLSFGVGLLIIMLFLMYHLGAFSVFQDSEATRLGAVVMIGLGLVIILLAALVIIYSVLDIANKDQALGLPEGSVRALLALSLVLVFVLLSAFLHNSLSKACSIATLDNVSKDGVDALKKDENYIVISALPMSDGKATNPNQAGTNTDKKAGTNTDKKAGNNTDKKAGNNTDKNAGNNTDKNADNSTDKNAGNSTDKNAGNSTDKKAGSNDASQNSDQLFTVRYYVRHKDADDLAKQIFTTLGTIFVTVIGFYFGTSAATSGANTVAKALSGGDGGGAPVITKLDPDKFSSSSLPAALKIVGERLGTVSKVKFGNTEAKPDNIADKLILVTAPKLQPGHFKVSVVGANGESSTLDLEIT